MAKKRKKKATARKKKAPARKKKAPARKKKASSKRKAAPKKKKSGKKRKPNPAFMKQHPVTDNLKTVLGVSKVSYPQATKLVWVFIRKHKLQDKVNRRMIHVKGNALGKIFPGKSKVSMFDLPKGIQRNLKK